MTNTSAAAAAPLTARIGAPILRTEALSISFRGVRALTDVALAIHAGGITSLIGPNGAGKTTLLNCINGLYRHQGQIFLDELPITRLRADQRNRRGIARTFQTPTLLDELSATDNVALGAHRSLRGLVGGFGGSRTERAVRREAMSLLDRLGIAHLAERAVGGLAHGDRRRVETARALIGRPRLLLLDEPAAGLDDEEAHSLLTVAAEVADSCLLVEHNMQLVMSVSKHVIVLAAGQVLADGTPEAVSTNPEVVNAYLGDGVAL